ncbi:glycosyltransferase family 2 protein [Bosea sp. 2RAB26]|uniref:glycosyltransferase family 2 protein n=1 Tax=Bosea sp. 2RAB26 TaxID=3237476 RepID=UPI003F931C05
MTCFSIVTPSYNQGIFLRECLASVAAQKAEVEHIVIDGGSTDGSVEVIQEHADALAYWVTERDGGQYDAINRGFARATGDVFAWLNSDDVYFPWTLKTVAALFDSFPHIEWLTTRYPTAIDANGAMIKVGDIQGFDRKSFFDGMNLAGAGWEADGWIQQESTFWRRSLWDRAGGKVRSDIRFAADFDLWCRFFKAARLHTVDVPLGTYRYHEAQKTSTALGTYVDEAREVLLTHGGHFPDPEKAAWRAAQRRLPSGRANLTAAGWAEHAPMLTYDWVERRWTEN